MGAQVNAPVIIKRKKVIAGDGHHGGAWKVAYADFVTAMMAFFMLMWLLNATTEKQRKGIADYFNPTIPINRISGGGDGAFGGDSVFTEQTLAQNGIGATMMRPTPSDKARGESGGDPLAPEAQRQEADSFNRIQQLLTAKSGESMVRELALRHIVTRVTDEGLLVEIFDLPDVPLFERDTDNPTEMLQLIVGVLAEGFTIVSNRIGVAGHTRAYPEVLRTNPVWALSHQRADRVRRMIEDAGLPEDRMQRVTGYADRLPSVRNPMAARNNRIMVTLLRSDR